MTDGEERRVAASLDEPALTGTAIDSRVTRSVLYDTVNVRERRTRGSLTRLSRIEILQPRFPHSYPSPTRLCAQLLPPFFARSFPRRFGLEQRLGNGFDEIDAMEEWQEDGRGDPTDSRPRIEGSKGALRER